MSNTKIYVGNLPFSVTVEELSEHFQVHGEISDCALITDRETGRSRGFGFITFVTEEAKNEALSKDNTDFGGRNINVRVAEERRR